MLRLNGKTKQNKSLSCCDLVIEPRISLDNNKKKCFHLKSRFFTVSPEDREEQRVLQPLYQDSTIVVACLDACVKAAGELQVKSRSGFKNPLDLKSGHGCEKGDKYRWRKKWSKDNSSEDLLLNTSVQKKKSHRFRTVYLHCSANYPMCKDLYGPLCKTASWEQWSQVYTCSTRRFKTQSCLT